MAFITLHSRPAGQPTAVNLDAIREVEVKTVQDGQWALPEAPVLQLRVTWLDEHVSYFIPVDPSGEPSPGEFVHARALKAFTVAALHEQRVAAKPL